MIRTIDLKGGSWLRLDPSWLDSAESTALMTTLLDELVWEERSVVWKDRETTQPRLVAWAGELPYRYSGQTLPPRPATAALTALWPRIEDAAGAHFNHAVINRYRDGRDHMAVHADNEPELGKNATIAALSLGSTRAFRLELKRRRGVKRSLRLGHGSLLIMEGACQHRWRHSVPRADPDTAPRLNVTFRWLHGPPGWRDPTAWPAHLPTVRPATPEDP